MGIGFLLSWVHPKLIELLIWYIGASSILDDTVIFSKMSYEHFQRLDRVFVQLNYLGHVVSEDGVETDPKKVIAIVYWPCPVTVTSMRSCLGFTSLYHWFILKHAYSERPLNILIFRENASKKNKPVVKNTDYGWAFWNLKELCG